MKKRIKSAILLTLVLIFLFPQSTGCAPKEIEQTNDSLRVAYFGTNIMVSYPLYEFKQQHPDVEVTTDFQAYGGDCRFSSNQCELAEQAECICVYKTHAGRFIK